MKHPLPLIIFITLISCHPQQTTTNENKAVTLLTDFYTQLFNIYETIPISQSSPVKIRHEKLDSLLETYCTPNLRSEAKKALEDGYGHDLLTKDLIGNHNENLKVEKDPKVENVYIVSFTATYSDSPGGASKKEAVIHVTVVKDGDSFKIESVKY